MPNKTANYNLTKPLESDYYDINVSNENMDIIDREIKRVTEESNKRIEELEADLQDNGLSFFKTDVQTTKLEGSVGGFLNIDSMQGQTLNNLNKFTAVNYSNTEKSYKIILGNGYLQGRVITIVNNSNRTIGINIGEGETWKRAVPCSSIATKITLTSTEYITSIEAPEAQGWTDSNKNELLKTIILEGDCINKAIPNYFEGIKSVGEPIPIGENLYHGTTETFSVSTTENTETAFYFFVRKPNNGDNFIDGHAYYRSFDKVQFTFSSGNNSMIELVVGVNGNKKDNKKILPINVKPNTDYIAEFGVTKNELNSWNIVDPSLKELNYKIEVLSQGKNLLDLVQGSYIVDNEVDKNGDFYSTCTRLTHSKGKISVKSNTNYILSINNIGFNYRLVELDSSKHKLSDTGWIQVVSNTINIFTKNTTEFLCVAFKYDDVNEITPKGYEIQLEKGNIQTLYEQYKGDRTEILMQQPLREWDSIYNNRVVTRGSGQIVLNGSENWIMSKVNTNTINFYIESGDFKSVNASVITTVSDKLNSIPQIDGYINDNEGVWLNNNGLHNLFITINKSKLITQDVSGLKTWLSQNNVTVVYQLTVPKIENLNKALNLISYGYLNVNSGAIQPEVTYSYAKNSGERMTSMENRIANIDTSGIEKNIADNIGDILTLTTKDKRNIVSSINEVNGSITDKIDKYLGDISKLQTNDKTSIVSSINELFQLANSSLQSVNNGKNEIINAVGGINNLNGFGEMATYIKNQKTILAESLSKKKDSYYDPTMNLSDLIKAVQSISTKYATGKIMYELNLSATKQTVNISANNLNFQPKLVLIITQGFYVKGDRPITNLQTSHITLTLGLPNNLRYMAEGFFCNKPTWFTLSTNKDWSKPNGFDVNVQIQTSYGYEVLNDTQNEWYWIAIG